MLLRLDGAGNELYSSTTVGRHTFEGVEGLERLGTDLLRAAFPDLPAVAALRVRCVAPGGWHHMAIVEDSASPRRRLLLKVLPAERDAADAERQARMMATEYRLLAEVAPRIPEEDPGNITVNLGLGRFNAVVGIEPV